MAKGGRYIPVRGIRVFLWGKPVGAFVQHTPGYYAFEYEPSFLTSGLDIAPLKMPLKNGTGPYAFTEFGHNAFQGLPGIFADSLPDGFGNALIGGAPPEAEEVFDPWCGWHDQHAIMVNGKQSHITDDDLLTVGDRFAIGTAPRVLKRIKEILADGGGE